MTWWQRWSFNPEFPVLQAPPTPCSSMHDPTNPGDPSRSLGSKGDETIPRYDPLPQACHRATSLTLWSCAPLVLQPSGSACRDSCGKGHASCGSRQVRPPANQRKLQRNEATPPAPVYVMLRQPSRDTVEVEVNEWQPGSTWGIPSLKVLSWGGRTIISSAGSWEG